MWKSFSFLLHNSSLFSHFSLYSFPIPVFIFFCWELSVFHLKIITKQINEKLSKINNKFKRRVFLSSFSQQQPTKNLDNKSVSSKIIVEKSKVFESLLRSWKKVLLMAIVDFKLHSSNEESVIKSTAEFKLE